MSGSGLRFQIHVAQHKQSSFEFCIHRFLSKFMSELGLEPAISEARLLHIEVMRPSTRVAPFVM